MNPALTTHESDGWRECTRDSNSPIRTTASRRTKPPALYLTWAQLVLLPARRTIRPNAIPCTRLAAILAIPFRYMRWLHKELGPAPHAFPSNQSTLPASMSIAAQLNRSTGDRAIQPPPCLDVPRRSIELLLANDTSSIGRQQSPTHNHALPIRVFSVSHASAFPCTQ